jgi:hypothetical protein
LISFCEKKIVDHQVILAFKQDKFLKIYFLHQ